MNRSSLPAKGPPTCAVNTRYYRGWRSHHLSNGLIALEVVPEIGGRVIQFQLAEHPFFFVNPELAGQVFPPEENGGGKGGWKNYGGDKLWPAPQGWEHDDQWPGPPDPILDGGCYAAEIIERTAEHVAIRVTSPPDPRSGIQISRTISLFRGSTRVRHACVMKNISQRPVRWSIWDVSQFAVADARNPARINPDFWAYCPLNPRSLHPNGFYAIYGPVNHPAYRPDSENRMLAVKFEDRVGKVGLDSDGGWLAVVNGQSDHCFIAKFPPFPAAPYPDQASVEFWLNGPGEFVLNGATVTNSFDPKETPRYLEAEILSPSVTLQPKEETRFQVDWFATRCPKPIVEVSSAGVVHERLLASLHNGRVRLQGVFGVFYPGRVEAIFCAADGKTLKREDLGPVEPNQVFGLGGAWAVPAAAARVRVKVLDLSGRSRGTLGHARIV